MSDKWIIIKEGQSFAPVTLKTLRTWVYERRVDGQALVSSDGGKTWSPAANTLELMPFFPDQTTSISEVPRGYSGKVERKRRSIEVIDMIPMLDMVFLLLIFFAVTSTFEMQRILEMTMPETSTGEVLEPSRTLTVRIDKLNQVFLEEEPVDVEDYKNRLEHALMEGAQLTLVIKGDEQALHGNVIHLMDIAKGAGVEKIMVTVKKKGS